MMPAQDVLQALRPLHVCVRKTGHIDSAGRGFAKLVSKDLRHARFLEVFEVLQPSGITDMTGLRAVSGHVLRLRLRTVPDLTLRGLVLDDTAGGVILDLSFGIAVIDAVQQFDLTAQDFAVSDLAVELLFLQEAKSTAMAASFSLNARLDGARAAAETDAMTDGLTGLHNRRALDTAMQRLGPSQTEYAILHIDLDLFKQVNDMLGHAVGDAVLKRVAGIMRRHTRKDDLLIRAGGDEFIIVCPALTDRSRLTQLAESMISDISKPFEIGAQTVKISASIGIGLSTSFSKAQPSEVSEIADVALYAAKRSGRGRHIVWSSQLGETLDDLDMPHIAIR